MFYYFALYLIYIFVKILYRLEVKGTENLPAEGAVIVVANHANLMDPIFMGIGLKKRRICFMAKEQLFKIPILGSIIRMLGVFPVRRGAGDREAYKSALRILEQGKVLGMFPEGTRHRDAKIHPLRAGAATLAVKSGAKIVPMVIQNTNKIKFMRFPKVRILVGEALEIKLLENKKETIDMGTQLIQEKLASLYEEVNKKTYSMRNR